jgi:hypothetical protein
MSETLEDIVKDMRDPHSGLCRWYADGGNCDCPKCVFDALADRIEAAARERGKWERERRAYEKLHDCFWEEHAIQNIVRQMLGARDDLRIFDPIAADNLQYYAHEFMRAAQSAPATPPKCATRKGNIRSSGSKE